MKKLFFAAILLQLFVTALYSQPDTSAIKSQIEKYKQAIDNADTLLASQIWAHTPEVSFIQPRGHQQGWQEINDGIYKFFGEAFAKRSLNILNEKISVYDNVAWVEFYWVFDATLKNGNAPLQTKGRETQIWRKLNNQWFLVHVHYSNMPVTQNGKGF
ncbi:MAG TPA: nuclear transport factor 2 family protein [Chitinophagaceae bacterium]|jgi:ketosteroid isomerase-like protein|nr:nuclear transport factor 2 family protein [Chitinophagaceae bacterium]